MSSEESRSRRVNAGRNIGKLVNQELGGDEFYSSLYGGFEEEEEDLQYEVSLIKAHQLLMHSASLVRFKATLQKSGDLWFRNYLKVLP